MKTLAICFNQYCKAADLGWRPRDHRGLPSLPPSLLREPRGSADQLRQHGAGSRRRRGADHRGQCDPGRLGPARTPSAARLIRAGRKGALRPQATGARVKRMRGWWRSKDRGQWAAGPGLGVVRDEGTAFSAGCQSHLVAVSREPAPASLRLRMGGLWASFPVALLQASPSSQPPSGTHSAQIQF
jgi:hypothetical protein